MTTLSNRLKLVIDIRFCKGDSNFMKFNRRILILLSITVLIVLLNACNPSTSNNQTEPSKSIGENSKVQDNNIHAGLVKQWEYSGIRYQYKPILGENSIITYAENSLLKIDKETGEKNSEVFLNANYTGNFCIDDNIMASCNSDGILEAIDVNNGAILWDYGIPSQMYCKPVAKDDILYSVSTNGILFALDIKTGQELWEFNPDNGSFFNQYNSPVIIGDTLYFLPGQNSNLYAVDLATRKEKWHLGNLDLNEVFLSNVNSTIYAVSDDGITCAIGAEKGQLLWKKSLSGNGKNGNFFFAAIDKECLTIFSLDKHIYRIDLVNGDLALDYTYEGSGAIDDVTEIGNALFFTTDNDIVSIDKKGDNSKHYNLSIPIGGKIASDGNELYFTSTDGKLLKYKLTESR